MKAVLKNGVIYPQGPLPADWTEGTELEVAKAPTESERDALDRRYEPRLALLFLGAALAHGQRPVIGWARAARLSDQFRHRDQAVAAAGKKTETSPRTSYCGWSSR